MRLVIKVSDICKLLKDSQVALGYSLFKNIWIFFRINFKSNVTFRVWDMSRSHLHFSSFYVHISLSWTISEDSEIVRLTFSLELAFIFPDFSGKLRRNARNIKIVFFLPQILISSSTYQSLNLFPSNKLWKRKTCNFEHEWN